MEGFIVTIPIRLILYISTLPPIISPPQPLPAPLKAIARDFLVLFHIGIWSLSSIYHHLNLFHSPSPLPLVSPHTLYLFYSPTTSWKHHLYSIVLLFIFCQRSVNYIYRCLSLGSLFRSINLMSILSLIPHCSDYCSIIVSIEIGCC
jgi:hypothetical protein